MRTTIIYFFGALALACNGAGETNDETTSGTSSGVDGSSSSVGGSSSSSTTTTATTGPECTPGTEGCACDEGACEGELQCYSEICVMLPTESSSSGGVETSSSSAAESSSESSSGAAESSSTGVEQPVACEEEGNHVCHGGVLDVCTDGYLVTQSCDDQCAETGYLSPGCADGNACQCDGFLDAACETIVSSYCGCYLMLYGADCSEGQFTNLYDRCYDPELDPYTYDAIVCIDALPHDTAAECQNAIDSCL